MFYYIVYKYMNLERLFWSKAKIDILKYLIFKRQWISMRALENELEWTFPAIKKQIDSLNESGILFIDKNSSKRSIRIKEEIFPYIKNIILFSLELDIKKIFDDNKDIIEDFYLWKVFWINIEMDIIILYGNIKNDSEKLSAIKENINKIFNKYFIWTVTIVSMSYSERQKRYKLADRFVLNIIKNLNYKWK